MCLRGGGTEFGVTGTAAIGTAAVGTAAVLALVYLVTQAGRAGNRPLWAAWVKAASVAALALAGIAGGAPGPVVAGLVLGALGDFALARPGERAFLAGMAAFAAGHLAYAGAFAGAAGMPSLPVLAAGVVLAAGAAALLGPRAGPLVWPVRGYGAVIGAMAACALALPDPAARAGAALFVASDALLAVALFRAPGQGALRPLGLAVWSCYWLGQALILLGMQP